MGAAGMIGLPKAVRRKGGKCRGKEREGLRV